MLLHLAGTVLVIYGSCELACTMSEQRRRTSGVQRLFWSEVIACVGATALGICFVATT